MMEILSGLGTGFAVADTPIPPSYLNPTCFATGTLIDTANGPRPVDRLVAGDLVLTRDRGLRPLAWAGGRGHELAGRVLRHG